MIGRSRSLSLSSKLFCALAAGLTACGSAPDAKTPAPAAGASASASAGGASAPTSAAPSAAAPPGEAITILSTGEDPKRPLRYAFHTDIKEILTLDMRMTMAMALDGQEHAPVTMPPMRMKMLVDPLRLTPQGDLVYRFGVESVDTQDDGTADPHVKAALDEQLKHLLGMSGEGEVTPRGQTVRATVSAPPDAGEQMRDLLDELTRAMKELAVPLPAEPVGRGAKWTATTPFHMKVFDATRTVTYTLSQTQGDRGTIDFSVALTAPSQALHSPRFQGTRMTLDSLNASGQGRTRFDLQRLVPTADGDTKIDVAMSFEAQGTAHTMNTKTQLGMHVAPGP
jgi:hypothetical protein